MKANYYTCKVRKLRIDRLLQEAAGLFTACGKDSTKEDKLEAKEKEKVILKKISEIDPVFAERCGWKPKLNT